MGSLRGGAFLTADRLVALEEIEKRLVRRQVDEARTVELRPDEIQMMPVIFQPREFKLGLKETDTQYVERLEQRMGIVGDLDPVVVIKIKGDRCSPGDLRKQHDFTELLSKRRLQNHTAWRARSSRGHSKDRPSGPRSRPVSLYIC
jgi:hypothetical protein